MLGTNNQIKLKEMKIKGIIDNIWKLISKNSLEQKLNENFSILKYMSLIKSIPKEWKDKISKTDTNLDINTLIITYDIYLKIGSKFKSIEKVTSKE